MKPIFTIHEGEYLVGNHIEQHVLGPDGKKLNVWIPSKDTGVDILVTDKSNHLSVSLQVKYSKDFLVTHFSNDMQEKLLCCGWWSLNREKLVSSVADYWVLVLYSYHKIGGGTARNSRGKNDIQYIILRPKELAKRLDQIHGAPNRLQTYLWVTRERNRRCIETRGLRKNDSRAIVFNNTTIPEIRDFSQYLNNWNSIFETWTETEGNISIS